MGFDSDESRVCSSGVPMITKGGVLARVYLKSLFEVVVRASTCSGVTMGIDSDESRVCSSGVPMITKGG